MDSLLFLAGLIGAVWSLPGACFGLLLGGMAAGALLGRPQAVWGSLLGTLVGGILACLAILAEFRRDVLLGALLFGSVTTPLALAGGLAGYVWAARRRPFNGAAADPGRP